MKSAIFNTILFLVNLACSVYNVHVGHYDYAVFSFGVAIFCAMNVVAERITMELNK